MKKIIHNLVFLSLILSLLFTSCVSNKKFAASEARVYDLQRDSINTHSQLNDCKVQVNNLKSEKASLQQDKTSLQSDKESLQNKNIAGEHNLKTLADESNLTIEAQAKQLKDFRDIIQTQSDIMNDLKNTISKALMNYEADELSIYLENGNVYVSLQDKLLFKSGSDIVDPKGKEALKTLSEILISTVDINVIIEGHTDNVPIKTEKFKDNWELSTARATTIVRLLTDHNGFDSNRITASGRGQFHPVQTNETEEGRAANRRTEIILSPDLKELYKLLNK
ncbi:MAG: OmpA/MotB family protein [Bacteroidota bacterium]